jgi:hypothetical protein
LRTKTLIPLTAAIALLIGGCSGTRTGTPTPQESGSTGGASTSSSASPTSPEASELPIADFVANPCELLKADQVAQLGTFKQAVKNSVKEASQCRWAAQEVTKGVSYTVSIATNGVTFDTAVKKAQSSPYFKTTTVLEYPAFNADGTDAKGSCSTGVGTPSKGNFLVQINMENQALPEYNDPCTATQKVAELVVKNLKG